MIQDSHIYPLWYSDHHIVMCTVRCEKPQPLKVSQTSRDFRKLDQQKFCKLLENRFSEIPQDCDDPDKLCDMYESIMSLSHHLYWMNYALPPPKSA